MPMKRVVRYPHRLSRGRGRMTIARLLLGAIALGCSWKSATAQTQQWPDSPVTPAKATAENFLPPIPSAGDPTATSVLTAPPGAPSVHPAGTVTSPWRGGSSGGPCCGPTGGNGPVTYELYTLTGPSLAISGSELSGRLKSGWTVGTGVRTLLFNQPGDAAWVLDLGVGFTYNRGRSSKIPIDVLTPRVQLVPGGQPTPLPDGLAPYSVRGLSRTNFNFSIGRDWFLRSPGLVGSEVGPNWRVGGDVGGRYGTSHVDLVPIGDPTNYLRKHSVTQSVFTALHTNYEVPVRSFIFFTGVRTEVDYTFTNVVPPKGGDILSLNIYLTAGVRY